MKNIKRNGHSAIVAMVGIFSRPQLMHRKYKRHQSRPETVVSRASVFEFIGSERYNSRLAVRTLLLLFMLAVPAIQHLYAQASNGLTGRVSDPSGADIAGAQITFINEATGIKTQIAASSAGLYTVPLAAGTYDITVEAKGFERFEQTHVVVEVGAETTNDIKLTMGAISQTVEVSSLNSLRMDTTDPQLDSMLPSQEVSDLPLLINGYMRQITSFATLAPGVRSGPYGSVTVEGGASGQINSAGNYYNGLQIDTASDVNSNPPYEMVDQFRVIRNAFSARYGMVQGAVDYNMRSGTNQLHGDGFFIDRNSVFDSAGFFPSRFDSSGKAIAPVDEETDWGGTLGGPVVLPRIYNGRNKTFFLVSIDIFNKNQAAATASVLLLASLGARFFTLRPQRHPLLPWLLAPTRCPPAQRSLTLPPEHRSSGAMPHRATVPLVRRIRLPFI
jgi:hypothetical protein